MSCRKKSKKQLIDSSDDEGCQKTIPPSPTIRSQRLKRKFQNRGSFALPSRDKIWDAIPSTSKKGSLKDLSPKKTVNDFTKVYNTYNYDHYEDSSEDDSEKFIAFSSEDSELSEDSESSASSDGQKPESTRIKNYRRRIKLSSSSDEESGNSKNLIEALKDENELVDTKQDEQGDSIEVDGGAQEEKSEDYCQAGSGCSDDEEISPCKRRRNTSILDSDIDSDASSDCEENTSDMESRSFIFKKKKEELFQNFKDIQEQKRISKNEKDKLEEFVIPDV